MQSERLAIKHYRIHVTETRPDGPRKVAGLAAAWFALKRWAGTMPEGSSFKCATCASRRRTVTVIPLAPRVRNMPLRLAARLAA